MKNKKGIALILAVGILALLAVIATSFALNMRLEYKAAMNYYNGVKARYYAEAAVQEAIVRLREHVKTSAFDWTGEIWVQTGSSSWTDTPALTITMGSGATATIEDEASKININNANQRLLNNLCWKFLPVAAGDPATIASDIITNRPYQKKEELKRIAPFTTPAYYDAIEPYITVHSYVDANVLDKNGNLVSTGRSPININTASAAMIEVAFRGIQSDGTDSVPANGTFNIVNHPNDLGNLIGTLQNQIPIASWKEFEEAVDSSNVLEETSPTGQRRKTLVKYNCDPNRPKPTNYTTEFCFNSGGRYEIKATGTVTGPGGAILATKTVTVIVKIHDIYVETLSNQFGAAGTTHVRTTWSDSCPVNSSVLFGSYSISSADVQTIPGSVKLGFWDDFNSGNLQNEWVNTGTGDMIFANADSSDGDLELTDQYNNRFPLYVLDRWTWGDFSLRVFAYDTEAPPPAMEMNEVGWVRFRGVGSNSPGAVHTRQAEWYEWYQTGYGWAYNIGAVDSDPNTDNGFIAFISDQDAKAIDPTLQRWTYPTGQIRIFPDTKHDHPGDYTVPVSTDRAILSYVDKKTYNITARGSQVTVRVETASPSAYNSYSRNNISTTPGKIGLYGEGLKVAWDDIRIISPDGNFTSQSIALPSNATWGTITGTITQSDPVNQYGDVILQTSIGGISNDLNSDGIPDTDGKPRISLKTTDPFLALNSTSPSLRYKAWLTTADSGIHEIPLFEDVTITYLPKVEILSWKAE